MTAAVIGGVVTALGVSIVWGLASILPTLFFMGAVGGLGFVVGSAVKICGKGFDLKFGYARALCALLAGLAANYVRMSAADAMAHSREESARQMAAARAESDIGMPSSLNESLSDLGIDEDEFADDEEESSGTGSTLVLLLFCSRRARSFPMALPWARPTRLHFEPSLRTRPRGCNTGNEGQTKSPDHTARAF